MKKNQLSELTLEELNKQKKSTSGVLIGTLVVMVILSGVIFYLSITKHNTSLLTFIPIFLLSMLPGIIKLSQVNSEIKSRSLQD
ncbi:hypothetical protein [Pedobacter antarcticus]|uniref:hypothetical protein n=1 Tax=Pedobacter antarcticus TaxID=34086 RepID=UPI00292F9270|nr:hypothetical protein [Pedobacter antarcticus]